MYIVLAILFWNLVFVPAYAIVNGIQNVNNPYFQGLESLATQGIDGIVSMLTPFILTMTVFYKVEFFGQQAEDNDGTTEDLTTINGDRNKFDFEANTEPRGSISSRMVPQTLSKTNSEIQESHISLDTTENIGGVTAADLSMSKYQHK